MVYRMITDGKATLPVGRQVRIEFEGAFYHITSRGNLREKVFFEDKPRGCIKKINILS